MNTIKFNNAEFQVESYNKNTYFGGDTINSTATCTIVTNDVMALHAIAQTDITAISIYHNETLIYNLQNIQARIDNISEYLNGDSISISVSLTFDNE